MKCSGLADWAVYTKDPKVTIVQLNVQHVVEWRGKGPQIYTDETQRGTAAIEVKQGFPRQGIAEPLLRLLPDVQSVFGVYPTLNSGDARVRLQMPGQPRKAKKPFPTIIKIR